MMETTFKQGDVVRVVKTSGALVRHFDITGTGTVVTTYNEGRIVAVDVGGGVRRFPAHELELAPGPTEPKSYPAGTQHTVELTPHIAVLVVSQLTSLGVAFRVGDRVNNLIRVSICMTRKRLLTEIVKVMHERSKRS